MSRGATAGLMALLMLPALRAEAFAQQRMEEEYGARIREYTTEARFLSDLVDHLPDDPAVPSPFDHFGSIVGAPGILHYTGQIYDYLRALDAASPRVRVWVIGKSDEGRDVLAVAVADSATLARVEHYQQLLVRLSDPRTMDDAEAERIIQEAKPVYYATMGLHSPETGPPEMSMELAYRLAVEESPMIDRIRKHVIFVFTPVVEADGRDRIVDWYYREKAWKAGHGLPDSVDVPGFPRAPYWGKYVGHDNNRDGLQLSQKLSRVMLDAYMAWRPLVFHDLHQSVPLLYVSTGTGPYNADLDPIVIDEWYQLAYNDVTEMTRRGMPGVWTHGFYTGWASNYLIWYANLRNAIGRFYETFGGDADTQWETIDDASKKEWYRPDPAPDTVLWSLRNNTNYMETGLLLSLDYVARNDKTFLHNYYLKAKRQVERGRSEPPYAYMIPAEQARPLEAVKLVNLLRRHGAEVNRLTAPATVDLSHSRPPAAPATGSSPTAPDSSKAKERTFAAGDYVVRLDQPYRALVRQILGLQKYPEGKPVPYDDTGWTLSLLRNVEAVELGDSTILGAPMKLLDTDAEYDGAFEGSRDARAWAIPYRTQNEMVSFRFALRNVRMFAAEDSFEAAGHRFGPGAILIPGDRGMGERLQEAARRYGLEVYGLDVMPAARRHEIEPPRIAFVHTWLFTQNSGWVRYVFDRYGIPYDYLSDQEIRKIGDLRTRYDVIVFPMASGNSQTIVEGALPLDQPVAWKRSTKYRNIGVIDETDDMTGGMGLTGLANLRRFVEGGGLLITVGSTSQMVVDYGLVRDVQVRPTRALKARGTIVRARSDSLGAGSPLLYGYSAEVRDSLPVYYNMGPVLQVVGLKRDDRARNRFPADFRHARPILTYAKGSELLLSGGLEGGGELAERVAVADAPLGKGHVLLFGIRPFWRWETQGSMPLVFNAILNWDDLGGSGGQQAVSP